MAINSCQVAKNQQQYCQQQQQQQQKPSVSGEWGSSVTSSVQEQHPGVSDGASGVTRPPPGFSGITNSVNNVKIMSDEVIVCHYVYNDL